MNLFTQGNSKRLLNEIDEGQNQKRTPPYDRVKIVHDAKVRNGKEWAKYGGNFPVERNGRVYYVSRSISVSMYCYCRNKRGEWCILANQRGSGAPNNQGLWNVPCGYLDYNETANYAAKRETYEETGVNIPISKIHMMGVNSGRLETDDDIAHRKIHPAEGKQDVSMRFTAVLDGIINNYPLSAANSEPGEVADIRWIPLSKVKNYQWAYGMGEKVISQAKTSVGDFNNKDSDDLPTLIARMRRMLGGYPMALSLFNEIINKTNNSGKI